MIGASVQPGCVVPSMITGSVIGGSAESSRIVCAPDGVDGEVDLVGRRVVGRGVRGVDGLAEGAVARVAAAVVAIVVPVDDEVHARRGRCTPIGSSRSGVTNEA